MSVIVDPYRDLRSRPSSPILLAQSGVAAALTGSTDETTLASLSLPAGLLRTGARLRVYTLFSMTGSTNAKTKKVKLGSTAFLSIATSAGTTVLHSRYTDIFARGRASQVCVNAALASAIGNGTSAPTTGTEDLDTALTLAITGQLANSGETLTLEAYAVELLNP